MTDYQRIEQERLLVEALVDDDHVELYHESASFRYAVDAIAQLLPPMVKGIAAEARETDAANATRAYAMRMMRIIPQREAWTEPNEESEQ